MKKNKLMRLASVLLVLTLLTTCVIGGTYAKYITSDSAHDVARVAKFGVVASISGDLFADSYGTSANTAQSWGPHKETVSAQTQFDAVVAPGTKGDPAKPMVFSVKGTPEVSTKVTFGDALDSTTGVSKGLKMATVELNVGEYGVMVPFTGEITADTIGNYWTYDSSADGGKFTVASGTPASGTTYYKLQDIAAVDTDNYLPIVWKYAVTSNTPTTDFTLSRSLKAVKTAIEAGFGGASGTSFTPNSSNALSAELTWEWYFENKSLTDTTHTAGPNDNSIYSNQDKADTILGDMIALNENALLNSDQYVVMKSGSNYLQVKTAEVKVISNATNNVMVAYTGATAPTAAYTGDILDNGVIDTTNGVCAVLSVAFNASLTVAQVD